MTTTTNTIGFENDTCCFAERKNENVHQQQQAFLFECIYYCEAHKNEITKNTGK